MKLTREDAIRLHRELWGWLAENPMKEKEDWPGWKKNGGEHPTPPSNCFCCQYAKDVYGFGRGSICGKCPLIWERLTLLITSPCFNSYFGKWDSATAPEERSRLAALIRDLPEKKVESKPKFKVGDRVKVREDLEVDSRYDDGCRFTADMGPYRGKTGVITKDYSGARFSLDIDRSRWRWSPSMLEPAEHPKPTPRFSVGDKVVPVSKTVPGFERDIAIDPDSSWRRSQKRGYFFVVGINEHKTKENGDRTVYFYCCNADETESCGSFYFESDLRPYEEPTKAELKPEYKSPAFKIGDRVKAVKATRGWGYVKHGDIGIIAEVPSNPHDCYAADFPTQKNWWGNKECFELVTNCEELSKPAFKVGDRVVPHGGIEEPVKPINHCPENKTVTKHGATFTFSGPATICIIEAAGCKFKGVAKCAPEDTWREITGEGWAYLRAMRKLLNSLEKNLREG